MEPDIQHSVLGSNFLSSFEGMSPSFPWSCVSPRKVRIASNEAHIPTVKSRKSLKKLTSHIFVVSQAQLPVT